MFVLFYHPAITINYLQILSSTYNAIFGTVDSLYISAQHTLANVSLAFILIFLSCPAETLSIIPVKNPSVVVCASYTVFVNTCKAMKYSTCFGIFFHMMHTGLAYAVYMFFYSPLWGLFSALLPHACFICSHIVSCLLWSFKALWGSGQVRWAQNFLSEDMRLEFRNQGWCQGVVTW